MEFVSVLESPFLNQLQNLYSVYGVNVKSRGLVWFDLDIFQLSGKVIVNPWIMPCKGNLLLLIQVVKKHLTPPKYIFLFSPSDKAHKKDFYCHFPFAVVPKLLTEKVLCHQRRSH